MSNAHDTLYGFIEAELIRPQSDAIMAMSARCAARFGEHTRAVLFYGSCLRTGEVEDKVLDFYVLVDGYRTTHGGMMAFWNWLIPPNVYYEEFEHAGVTLRAKFAVLTVADFTRRCAQHRNLSIWARFSQPAALTYVVDTDTHKTLVNALANACSTMLWASGAKASDTRPPEALWTHAFDLTYGAELRSEKTGKGKELFDLDANRYRALTPLILSTLQDETWAQRGDGGFRWFLRRVNGKSASFFRLIKGAFTFTGGIDYLAWKIGRHSGVEIEVTDAMRRRPIWSGLKLFIQLRRKGAFR